MKNKKTGKIIVECILYSKGYCRGKNKKCEVFSKHPFECFRLINTILKLNNIDKLLYLRGKLNIEVKTADDIYKTFNKILNVGGGV